MAFVIRSRTFLFFYLCVTDPTLQVSLYPSLNSGLVHQAS